MRFATITAVFLTGLLAAASLDAVAQKGPGGQGQGGQGQGGQGQGQGQQTQQQKRQMERSTSQDVVTEHERLQQRERDRTQKQVSKERAAGAGGVYGGNLMTEQERNEYRERLQAMKTEQDREAYEARHREEMQQRSKERNVPIAVTPD